MTPSLVPFIEHEFKFSIIQKGLGRSEDVTAGIFNGKNVLGRTGCKLVLE